MNNVYLSEEHTVSFFLDGLKDEIQCSVKMFTLQTLKHDINLAKLQEKAMETLQKKGKFMSENPYSNVILPTPKPIMEANNYRLEKVGGWGNKHMVGRPFKQLTSKEHEDKKKKGLCYVCDEKYVHGH